MLFPVFLGGISHQKDNQLRVNNNESRQSIESLHLREFMFAISSCSQYHVENYGQNENYTKIMDKIMDKMKVLCIIEGKNNN